ncbi:MAG: SDR family oxidoreductase, partial [Solirubrobacteraceae bacterium]
MHSARGRRPCGTPPSEAERERGVLKPVPVTERPILLTGATGFVGMAVLSRLLAADHEVHCLVRAADGAEADSRLRAVLARVQAPS